MLGLNSTLMTVALGGLALAGVGWFSYNQGLATRSTQLARNFERHLSADREIAIRREVNLWTLSGNAARGTREVIDEFQRISEASAEARAKMLAAMRKERETAAALEAEAARNIEELRNAATSLAEDWKRGVIPPDITCGVFDGKDCPEPAYPASAADPGLGVEVRDGRSAPGAGPPS